MSTHQQRSNQDGPVAEGTHSEGWPREERDKIVNAHWLEIRRGWHSEILLKREDPEKGTVGPGRRND
jgi:hypothetical protein